MSKVSHDGSDKTASPSKQVKRKTALHDGKSTTKKNMSPGKLKSKAKITGLVSLEGCAIVKKVEKINPTNGKVMCELTLRYPLGTQKNDVGMKISESLAAGAVLIVSISTKQLAFGIDDPPAEKKDKAQKSLPLKSSK